MLIEYSLTKEAQEKAAYLLGNMPARSDANYSFHPLVNEFVDSVKNWGEVDWRFMLEYDKDIQAGTAKKIFGMK